MDGGPAPTESPPGSPGPLGPILRDAATRELARAEAMLACHGARLHHGVHQGRKSMRRVRAALALAAPALGRSGWWVDRELRRTLDALSELRDGQALIEALHRVGDKAPPEQAALFARSVRVAEHRRADLARERSYVALDREGLDILATLRASLAGMPWERIEPNDVARMLRDSADRIGEALATVRTDSAGEEAWHDWRRRTRRLSQQQRLLAGTALAVDRGETHAVAERLGAAQDLSLLLAHCGRDSPFSREDRRELALIARERLGHERAALLGRPARVEVAAARVGKRTTPGPTAARNAV